MYILKLSNCANFNDLELFKPRFQITTLHLWHGTRYTHSYNQILVPFSRVSFRMILSYLEWLSKIFNDTKPRAVSLLQLSFLLVTRASPSDRVASLYRTTPYHLGRRGVVLRWTALRPASVAAQCTCPPEWEAKDGSVSRCRWCVVTAVIWA